MGAALELLGGLIGLVISGTAIVRGASVIGGKLGLPPLVIGLTIVAAGTSAPELAVVWRAADNGDAGLALGSVVGSNIANVLLVLGIVAVISAINVSRQAVMLDAPVMIGASVLVLLLGLDGTLSQTDGLILVTCLVVYIVTTILVARRNEKRGVTTTDPDSTGSTTDPASDVHADPDPETEPSASAAASAPAGQSVHDASKGEAHLDLPAAAVRERPAIIQRFDRIVATLPGSILLFIAGAVGVAVSAQFVVSGAGSLATSWGMSELVVGLTVLAVGTSAPEITTSIIAALRGHPDVALGNAIGSNIFNLLFVLGLVSSTHSDLPVESALQTLNLPVMLGAAALALPYAITRLKIERLEGVMFLIIYAAYTIYLVLDGTDSPAADAFGVLALVVITPLSLLVIASAAIRRRWKRARSGADDGDSEHADVDDAAGQPVA